MKPRKCGKCGSPIPKDERLAYINTDIVCQRCWRKFKNNKRELGRQSTFAFLNKENMKKFVTKE